MSGAKNCPETPRQKMIGMMYLVLTAMLALNVSADILNGFDMVNLSLKNSINNYKIRNSELYNNLESLYELNPTKVGEWLEKSKDVKDESDKLYDLLQEFKIGIIDIADGKKADNNGNEIKNKTNTTAAGQYAEIGTSKAKGKQLKQAINDYKIFVENMFDNNPIQVKIYDQIFNTDDVKKVQGEPAIDWITNNFADMPAIAVITMLSKYQSDVRTAEAELLKYFIQQQDARDFRVNKIAARIIPESKHVIQGGTYKAEIALIAIDTTKVPTYFIGEKKLDSDQIAINCGKVGTFPINGHISVTDPNGEKQVYNFNDEYTVGEPTATIANQDMNVVYRGYDNKMEISVPGIPSEKLRISADGAKITKQGFIYICNPDQKSQEISIKVSANLDNQIQSIGESKFRVRTLPSPTAYLEIGGEPWKPKAFKINRKQLVNAKMIAQYEDGMLNANFKVSEFTVSVSDGRGGFNSSKSDGNKFSNNQKKILQKLKPGTKIIIENIKYTGAKSGELSYPTVVLP